MCNNGNYPKLNKKYKWKLLFFFTFKRHLRSDSFQLATPCLIFNTEEYAYRKSWILDIIILCFTLEIELSRTVNDAVNKHINKITREKIESIKNQN